VAHVIVGYNIMQQRYMNSTDTIVPKPSLSAAAKAIILHTHISNAVYHNGGVTPNQRLATIHNVVTCKTYEIPDVLSLRKHSPRQEDPKQI
jgi:hypothetical protein